VNGAAVGCFHIEPDGKIAGVKFEKPSGDETLDDSVQRALKATQKTRNDKPQPVPVEQLGVIKKWVCFRFNPNQ
jgi:TonB family protein